MKKSRVENLDYLKILQDEMAAELQNEILPYWMESAKDADNGGFIGRITGWGTKIPESEKSCILNARLLWTFSAAYRVLGDEKYLSFARRSYDYMESHFYDKIYGGFFWSVDYKGIIADDKKHVYAHAFVLFGYSEFARATGSKSALKRAFEIFHLLEKHAADQLNSGYNEAFTREWKLLKDVRLSRTDADEQRSMNTHLHIMEAYSNLYRAENNPILKTRLEAIIELILSKIYDSQSKHFDEFFDKNWNPKSDSYSYGHDIEAAWLLIDASEAINHPELKIRVKQVAAEISYTTLKEGFDPKNGGIFNSGRSGLPVEREFDWWVQAEAIAGFLYAYELTGDLIFLETSYLIWEFIKEKIKDPENGEWFFRVNEKGEPYEREDKVGPWKCPYHNSRMCLIVIERFNIEFAAESVLLRKYNNNQDGEK